ALYRRRFCEPDRGRRQDEGQAHRRARSRSRPGVSGVRAVSLEDRARQCDVWPAPAGWGIGGGGGAKPPTDRDGRDQGLRGFLYDKFVVMTRAPGRINEVFDIHLPRPRRRADLLLDPHYQKYVVEIERMIDDTSEAGLRP